MSKVDAALSSLSGAVGGPVRLNGQSMKPLLEFFYGKNALSHCTVGLFKMILQIEAAQDLCKHLSSIGTVVFFKCFVRLPPPSFEVVSQHAYSRHKVKKLECNIHCCLPMSHFCTVNSLSQVFNFGEAQI